jgi:hypothetical protein
MAQNSYPTLSPSGAQPWEVAGVVRRIMQGKQNNTGTVTLTTSASSTTVDDSRVGADTVILFMPTTANAAAEIGNGTLYVSSRDKQQFTITHASNTQSDRTFGYVVQG